VDGWFPQENQLVHLNRFLGQGARQEQPLADSRDMEILFKRLPAHWRYLVSRRQIKEAVADVRESIRMIDFAGTGERPCKITGSCFAGTCESRFVDTGWCFRLTFQGLPDDVLGDAADDLTLQVLAGVREFLSEHREKVSTRRVGRYRCLLLWPENGRLVPSFSTSWYERQDEILPWW
jgi:hypothetical protein